MEESKVTPEQLDALEKEIRVLIPKGKQKEALNKADELFKEGPEYVLNDLTIFRGRLKTILDNSIRELVTARETNAFMNKFNSDFLSYLNSIDLSIPDPASTASKTKSDSPVKLRELVHVLSGKYWNMNDIARFAQDSDVGPQNITLTDDAQTAWHELITEAGNNQLWEDLRNLLLEDNKRDQKMKDLLNGYEPKDLFA